MLPASSENGVCNFDASTMRGTTGASATRMISAGLFSRASTKWNGSSLLFGISRGHPLHHAAGLGEGQTPHVGAREMTLRLEVAIVDCLLHWDHVGIGSRSLFL